MINNMSDQSKGIDSYIRLYFYQLETVFTFKFDK